MKKGRHRRFEEARALKRSHDVDLEDLFESLNDDDDADAHKPEHDAWADVAAEWESKNDDDEPALAEADGTEALQSSSDSDEEE